MRPGSADAALAGGRADLPVEVEHLACFAHGSAPSFPCSRRTTRSSLPSTPRSPYCRNAGTPEDTSKGRYDPKSKGPISFAILAEIDPTKVESAAPHAKQFLDTLRAWVAA